MVGWHHQLNGHEFEQVLGVGDGWIGKPGMLPSMGFSRQEHWSGSPRPSSGEIDGETVETVSDFIFLGSKITADGDCSHEIKRCLLLGRKVMTNLDSVLKRDITLLKRSI